MVESELAMLVRSQRLCEIPGLAFDVRFGPRDYFPELGAGFALASDSNAQSSRATVEGLWIEIGASVYLSSGSIAPYVGAGISPRLWGINGGAANDGIKGAVYGQFGVTFTRDSRFRIYSELRVSQNLISLEHGCSKQTFLAAPLISES